MDDESGPDCVVCLSEPKDTMFMPCRHLCVCQDCFRQLTRCPLCCSVFEQHIKVIAPTPPAASAPRPASSTDTDAETKDE